MSTPIKYLKDESNNTFSPAVSVDSIFTKGGGKLVDYIYPIGSIYMSVNSTNPSQLFGGTWTQLKDRFLLGVGNTYKTVSSTGGEATHTLTVSEMPSHIHGITTWKNSDNPTWGSGASSTKDGAFANVFSTGDGTSQTTGDNSQWYGINNSGNSQPHNNMPPYLTVYMWKRTK